MNKILKILLIIAIIVGGVYFLSHNKNKKSDVALDDPVKKEQSKREMDEFLFRSQATLLALKYKVDESKVFDMIVELYDIDNVDNILKPLTRDKLSSLSAKYSIPIETLAGMLIDYESMQCRE